MSLVLGLDTGGTFTDAALLDTADGRVLASAKALTTRADLSVGVGGAIAACLENWGGPRKTISRVSLSTTLATNAVVEGVGGRVGLILIGFDDGVLGRAGLGAALGADPVLQIAGGHKADGRQQARWMKPAWPPDLRRWPHRSPALPSPDISPPGTPCMKQRCVKSCSTQPGCR